MICSLDACHKEDLQDKGNETVKSRSLDMDCDLKERLQDLEYSYKQ